MTEPRGGRREHFWTLHDFSLGRGLEVGPLYNPIVRRSDGDVRYVDVHDRAGLLAHYEGNPNVPAEDVQEVDYVLIDPDGTVRSLVEVAKPGAPFAWAVASHVIEHVPDVIGWLQELGELVEDDGALVLVVPDRRYCFDVHRPPTTVGQMLDAHEHGDLRPSTRAVYDAFRVAADGPVQDLWAGIAPTYAGRSHTLEHVLDRVEEARSGTYVDCHVWLFTPDSFLQQLHELRELGAVPWYVEQVLPTEPDTLEFGVRLRRLPRSVAPGQPVAGELLSELDVPDWLAESLRGRRTPTEASAEIVRLHREVEQLRGRLRRRRTQLERLEGRSRRQARRIKAQRRRIRAMESSRRWRLGGALLRPFEVFRR